MEAEYIAKFSIGRSIILPFYFIIIAIIIIAIIIITIIIIIIIIITIIIITIIIISFLFCLCMCVGACDLALFCILRKFIKTFNNILKLPDL